MVTWRASRRGSRRAREGPGGGTESWTAGARLRGSRLRAEAGRGRGRSVTGEISATHAGLGSRRDLGKKRERNSREGGAAREAGQPWIRRHASLWGGG